MTAALAPRRRSGLPKRMPGEPVLPVGPLLDLVGGVATLALRVGVQRRQVERWRHDGLSHAQADAVAIRCGYHPAEVWPDW